MGVIARFQAKRRDYTLQLELAFSTIFERGFSPYAYRNPYSIYRWGC